MFKLNYFLFSLLFIIACTNPPTTQETTTTEMETDTVATEPMVKTEKYCFVSTFGEDPKRQDSTFVNLSITGDKVTGELHWHPFEKDGGHGTVKGTRQGNLIKVRYDYMIEGANQAEDMIFRIEAGKLVKKVGELMENEAGVLVLKDPTTAEFKEELARVMCTNRKLH